MINATLGLLFRPASRRIARLGPAVAWMIVIFVLSAVPGNRYPRIDIPNLDKGMHFLLFLPLGWLCARAATAREWRISWPDRLLASSIGIAYGALDEIHQHWVPFRTTSLYDWLIDCLAVVAGTAVWAVWCAVMSGNREPSSPAATVDSPASRGRAEA